MNAARELGARVIVIPRTIHAVIFARNSRGSPGKPGTVNIFIYSDRLKFPHGWKFKIPENTLVAQHGNAGSSL